MSETSSVPSSSCHDAEKTAVSAHGAAEGHGMKQPSDHSDCYFCQSGLCRELAVFKKALLFGDVRDIADVQCPAPDRVLLPFDLFLMPLEKKEPERPQKTPHFLSFHSWQSYYSIYRI